MFKQLSRKVLCKHAFQESDDEVELNEPYKAEEERERMIKEEGTMEVEEESTTTVEQKATEVEEHRGETIEAEKIIRVEEEIVQVSDEPRRIEEEIVQVSQPSQAILEDQKEVHREISLEMDIEGVPFEDVNQEIVTEMQAVGESLNEEDAVEHKQAETEEEEQIICCVQEQGDKAQHPWYIAQSLHFASSKILYLISHLKDYFKRYTGGYLF